jgi:hypothetical protein
MHSGPFRIVYAEILKGLLEQLMDSSILSKTPATLRLNVLEVTLPKVMQDVLSGPSSH